MPNDKAKKPNKSKRRVERFLDSGFGQIAEGLFALKEENKKTFWIGCGLALWLLANGLNNIGNLYQLVREGKNFLTILNPIAADVKPVASDSAVVK